MGCNRTAAIHATRPARCLGWCQSMMAEFHARILRENCRMTKRQTSHTTTRGSGESVPQRPLSLFKSTDLQCRDLVRDSRSEDAPHGSPVAILSRRIDTLKMASYAYAAERRSGLNSIAARERSCLLERRPLREQHGDSRRNLLPNFGSSEGYPLSVLMSFNPALALEEWGAHCFQHHHAVDRRVAVAIHR